MLRKLLTVCTILCIITMQISALALTPYNTLKEENPVPYVLLEKIGIVNSDEYTSMEAEISRGTFLKWAVRLSGIPDGLIPAATQQIFIDIAIDSEFAALAQYAYNAGIVKGTQYGSLKPDEGVTAPDAAAMAARAAGYYLSEEMEAKAKVNLMKFVSSSGKITVKDAMRVLWNALNLDSVKNTSAESYIDYGATLLEEIFRITEFEGIVDSDSIININGGVSSLGKNMISIDGRVYDTDGEIPAGYAGLKVCAYMYNNEYILCVNPKHNEVNTFDLDDVEKFEGGVITTDEGKKKHNVSSNAKTLKNFEREFVPHSGYVLPDEGTMVTIDNNNDNTIDCVFIYTPVYGLVKGSDTKENKLFCTGNPSVYALEEYDNAVICDSAGNIINLSDVNMGSVAEIYADSDMTNIVICCIDDVHVVTAAALDTSEEKIIEDADGTRYKLAASFGTLGGTSDILLGKRYEIRLDLRGKIVYAQEIVNDGLTYGYLYAYSSKTSIGSNVQLGIYSMKEELLQAEVSEKVKVVKDGINKKMTEGDLLDLLAESFSPGLVRFSTNEEGEVNALQFPSSDKFAEGFRCVGTTPNVTTGNLKYDTRVRLNVVNMIGGQILFDAAKTQILVVPNDYSDENEWRILSVKNGFVDGKYYPSVKGYGMNTDNMSAEVITIKQDVIASNYEDHSSIVPMLVTGFRVNTDKVTGESYTTIHGYKDGTKTTFSMRSTEMPSYTDKDGNVIAVEKGDVIRITSDYSGKVVSIKLLFDASEGKPYGINDLADDHLNYGFGYSQRTNYGQVHKIIGNTMYLIKEGESEPSNDIFRTDLGYVYEYDEDASEKARIISPYEIQTLENNPAHTDKIFIQSYYSNPMITVVYK